MSYKKVTEQILLCILCALLILPFFTSSVSAEPSKKIMRVGWFYQTGYQELDENNKPFGYNYEYLMRIAQYTGWEYEFVNVNSFAHSYEMIKNGELDILGYIVHTEERALEVSYPDISSGNVSTSLFVRKDSPIVEYDFEGLDGINVACMQSQNPLYLLEYAATKGFHVNLIYYENLQGVMDAVNSGKVDAGVSAGHQQVDTTRIVASFSPKPFYFVTRKDDSKALLQMNNALNDINLETPFYDRELAYKYLPQIKDTLMLTKAEERYIKDNPKIEISYYPNWFPISVENEKTGEFFGIARNVFDRLSQITGIEFTYTPVVRGTSEADNANVIAGMVENYSKAYDDDFRITNGYLHIPVVLVRKSNVFKDNPESTSLPSHLWDLVDCESIKDTKVVTYSGIEESLDAVVYGKTDQALLNAFACEYMLKQAKYKKLQTTMLYYESYDISIGIKNDLEPALYNILNKALSLISAADMNAIINKNTALSYDITLRSIVSQMPTDIVVIAVFALMMIIALMAFIIIRQRKHSKKIKSLLCTDELTGLLSFKGFTSQANTNILKTSNNKAFIIDFDINHFGEYNNINGYEQGNELLRSIANVAATLCHENELCARIQADHFVVLAFDKSTERIKEQINNAAVHFKKERKSKSNSLLLSYGIYEITDKKMSIVDICDRALVAKRSIKGNYDNFIAVYDEKLHKEQSRDVEILENFETALSSNEFIHYFQPKYDSNTCNIVGAEALVRWMRKDGQVIMPGSFIDLLEVNGLITKLDLYMFERLCYRMEALLKEGVNLLPVSINFSRVHLYDSEFASHLIGIAKKFNVPPSLIEIEITETSFIDHQVAMVRMVNKLHEVGFIVAIDDFGSGFSSLNILKDINFDIIKLDRVFLNALEDNDKSDIIISSVLSLAGKLNVKTVGEGVETIEQFEMLKNYGCDIIQGYYFAKPMPEEEYLRTYFKYEKPCN